MKNFHKIQLVLQLVDYLYFCLIDLDDLFRYTLNDYPVAVHLSATSVHSSRNDADSLS